MPGTSPFCFPIYFPQVSFYVVESFMRIVNIPKGNGKYRTIYAPNRTEKTYYKSLLGKLRRIARKRCNADVVHGFVRKRSPVTNALQHVGHAFTLCMDMADFFDSVTAKQLRGKIPNELRDAVLYDGAARQGLPTSPIVANIAAAELDRAILRGCEKRKANVIYTRYADDMAISFDDPEIAAWLPTFVKESAHRFGFKISDSKTRLYKAAAGRRIVTGVSVGEADIRVTRETRRKLRAIRHNAAKGDAEAILTLAGYEEWCRLRPPKISVLESGKVDGEELEKLSILWSLGQRWYKHLPDKGDDIVSECGKFIVTGDPVYMLGMSTYTTGWASCMAFPSGSRRRGSILWANLRGTRIAAMLSDKTLDFAGVTRRVMIRRALLHTLENGQLVYDRIYPGTANDETFLPWLHSIGAISVIDARAKFKDMRVAGHAPSKAMPYMDSLKSRSSKASAGPWKGKKVRIIHL